MKGLRGAENLAKFNSKRTEARVPLVIAELRLCKKRKLEFASLNLLASHIHDRTSIHRTTLMRNKLYLDLLSAYFLSQPGAVRAARDATAPEALLRLKLKVGEVDMGIVRQQVSHLESKLDRLSSAKPSPQAETSPEVALANVSMILCLVLARLKETMIVDFSKRAIIDLAARPSEAVVAGPDRAGALIAWLDRNRGLPIVAMIRGETK